MIPNIKRLIEIFKAGSAHLNNLEDIYHAGGAPESIIVECHNICVAAEIGSVRSLAREADKACEYLTGVLETPTGPYLDLRIALPYATGSEDFTGQRRPPRRR